MLPVFAALPSAPVTPVGPVLPVGPTPIEYTSNVDWPNQLLVLDVIIENERSGAGGADGAATNARLVILLFPRVLYTI